MDDSRAARRRCGLWGLWYRGPKQRNRHTVPQCRWGYCSRPRLKRGVVWWTWWESRKVGRKEGKCSRGVDSPLDAEEGAILIAPAVLGTPDLSASNKVVVVAGYSATCCGSVGSKLGYRGRRRRWSWSWSWWCRPSCSKGVG